MFKIKDAFVREQKRYSKQDLKKLFSFGENEIEIFIRKLKSYGVLKAVKKETANMTDLLDEDILVTDESAGDNECLYVFTYVGVITVGNRIIKAYPKYIFSPNDLLGKMKQIMKVLQKYNNSKEQIINIYNGSDENKSFNILAVILFLLNDYYEYGIYSNYEDINEVNGEGDIIWGKTIDEGFAFIHNNRPYYTELYTHRSLDDELDFFKRLHKCVITECSKQLKDSQLEELFQLDSVVLTDEKIFDLGDEEYILEQILKELNLQFNTRKQILLKTLYAYISQNKKLIENDASISMFGTNAFNMVWEKACADVFDNKLNSRLADLGLSSPLNKDLYNENDSLADVIPKPAWIKNDITKHASKTLKPDLICISKINDVDCFLILDAKYYNLKLEKDILSGTPGVEDIDKQYLYQLAYKDFIESQKFQRVINCFLMPTECDDVIDAGIVKMPIFAGLNLVDITVRKFPAKILFEHYLTQQKYSLSKMNF